MFSKLEAVPTSETHQYNPLSFIHLSPKLFRPLLIASVKTDHKNFRILSVPSIEIINELLQDVLVISNISG